MYLLRSMQLTIAIVTVATTALLFSIDAVSQETKYKQGLILDFYVVETNDDALGPKRRSVATMLDTTPNSLSYHEPMEIVSALSQYQDKFWGIRSKGYIKIDDPGAYTFNLMLNTNDYIRCSTWLKLQDKQVTSHDLTKRSSGNHNEYGEVNLKAGIYAFEYWLGCSDYRNSTKSTLVVSTRGPKDPIVAPIDNDRLLH